MTRSRRIGAGLLVVGLVLLVTPVAVWAASSSDGPDLSGFNLIGGASGVAAYFSPVQGDIAGVLAPEAKTNFGSGGSHAVAAVPWFGDLASNAGSLANLAVSACNNQCSPLNYPVRAEAASGGTQGSSLGPLTASVKDGAKAVAELANLSAPGLVEAARISTESRGFFEGGKAVSLANTTLSGVNVAGGAVTIDSLQATAKVTTDGNKTTREHSLVVQGLEIGGQKARVENGKIVFAGQSSDNPLASAADQFNQGAGPQGPHVFVTKPIDDADKDGTARVDSGALAIYWDTAGDQSAVFVIALGGANASAQATPGIAVPGVADVGPAAEPTATGAEPAAVASLSPSGSPALDNAVTPPKVSPQAKAGRGTAPVALGEERATFTKGVSPGLVVMALIGAVVAGIGLRKLQSGVLSATGPGGCVNDRRRT